MFYVKLTSLIFPLPHPILSRIPVAHAGVRVFPPDKVKLQSPDGRMFQSFCAQFFSNVFEAFVSFPEFLFYSRTFLIGKPTCRGLIL